MVVSPVAESVPTGPFSLGRDEERPGRDSGGLDFAVRQSDQDGALSLIFQHPF
ncbi:MAG: hypothetical protein QOH39_1846 [Verrucomicrobiota bacterium]|jgi:hypothetical protein